ncbi:MAG: class I SAM-dependent methyltransferase [Deltaproteobacteria bacterium]|nr:class I SAM-dependent methyltransferase [Deltaproteobacteria bacterium]
MEYEDKMKKLPSGIYKSYLIEKVLSRYTFQAPILEIGCGTGEFLETLNKFKLHNGDLIDFNNDTIQHCREKCSLLNLHMNVYCTDLFDFASEKKYNSIFMFEILEHIENDEAALEKVFALLNPQGLFLMSVPAKQSLFSDEDTFQGHLRRYERNDLCNKLRKAGFVIEFFWCYNPLPYITKFLIKRRQKASHVGAEVLQKTKDSSHVYYPTTKKLVDIFYPIYSTMHFILKVQNLVLKMDFGAHYLVLGRKI